jgi:hypothetical protein
MSGFEIHQEPEYAYRRYAPCAPVATATFDVGDPVQLATNQLSDCPDDQTELLVGECIGFACEPAEGTTAGSRATAAADGFGVVENQMRAYWPFNAPGLLLRTRHFVLAADFFTEVEKDGTEIGDTFNIKGQTGTNVWGVEEEAPTYATGAGTVIVTDSLAVQVVAILDNDMNPITADDTQTAGDGWIVFKPIGFSQCEFGGV